MTHSCMNCKHRYVPESSYDYFKKTHRLPDMCKWGDKEFDPEFWLCDNPQVSDIDHASDKMFMKNCTPYNKHGNCIFFRAPDAIDITINEVQIESDDLDLNVGDESILSVTIKTVTSTPDTPAGDTTNDTTNDDTTDDTSEGDISTTSDDEEITEGDENEEQTNPAPEEENTDTEIEIPTVSYKYQWYKNGRKLYKETTSEIVVDTTKEDECEYYCAVTQYIENNNDGGVKSIITNTNSIKVVVSESTDTPNDDTTTDTPAGNDDTSGESNP